MNYMLTQVIACVENTQNRKSRRFRSILADMSTWRCAEGVPPLKAKLRVRKVRKITLDKVCRNMYLIAVCSR